MKNEDVLKSFRETMASIEEEFYVEYDKRQRDFIVVMGKEEREGYSRFLSDPFGEYEREFLPYNYDIYYREIDIHSPTFLRHT